MRAGAGAGAGRAAGTLALGAALLLTAGLFDAEPLFVPGSALVLLTAGAWTWVWAGARGVRIRRTVSARRIEEEQPLEVELLVRGGALGLPSGAIEDALLSDPAPLAAGRPHTRVRITARFARRGARVLPAPRVLVRDPFGLASRTASAAGDDELLVLPAVHPVLAPDGSAGGTVVAHGRGRPAATAEVELDGLRRLRDGASASRIFWPSVARGGEPMERRLKADGDTRPLVVLDPRGARTDEDLDAAVRAVASLAVHLATRGGVAVLLPGDRRPVALDAGLHGWPAAHVRLALLDGRGVPPLAGLASRRGPVLYVAARSGARPPRALAHAPAGRRVLITPGPPPPGRRPVFSVAGCHGYDLAPTRRLAVA